MDIVRDYNESIHEPSLNSLSSRVKLVPEMVLELD